MADSRGTQVMSRRWLVINTLLIIGWMFLCHLVLFPGFFGDEGLTRSSVLGILSGGAIIYVLGEWQIRRQMRRRTP